MPTYDGLDLAMTPDGDNPLDRFPWGSVAFTDEEGHPIIDGLYMRQYFTTVDGVPIRTTDGHLIHWKYDPATGRVVEPRVLVPVEPPEPGTKGQEGRLIPSPYNWQAKKT